MRLYQIRPWGVVYIQPKELYDMALQENIPIIGTDEFILRCFECPVFEIDDVEYPADDLDTATKIQCFIDEGLIKEITA